MFHFCHQCGSFFKVEKILCQFCWSNVHDTAFINISSLFQNAYVTSQFIWSNSSPQFVPRSIKGIKTLKSAWHSERYIFDLHRWFSELPSTYLHNKKSLVWIPVPCLTNVYRTTYLAHALKKQLGGRVVNALTHLDHSMQKTKSREARLAIKFSLRSNLNLEELKDHILILVDDIVTTGATLKACQQALGINYLVAWTFAYRSKIY